MSNQPVSLKRAPPFQNLTPFKTYMHQDVAAAIVKRTYRKTRRKPEIIGHNEHGDLVKWYLVDCTLTLGRYTKHAPYRVIEIGPQELEAEQAADV